MRRPSWSGWWLAIGLCLMTAGAPVLAQDGEEPVDPERAELVEALREELGEGASEEEIQALADEIQHSPFYIPGVTWTQGPAQVEIGDNATLELPDGWWFTGPDGTWTAMEYMENIPSPSEVATVAPPEGEWFVVFRWDPVGYVPDDEKDDIDPDELLDSIRASNEAGNEARRERGWDTLELVGWKRPPYFDDATKRLQWATEFRSSTGPVVNHNIRVLGRRGVMEVQWVGEPDSLDSALPDVDRMLAQYDFTDGERYAEFREGDKVAKYGLAALITGGAVAVGAKSGLFKHLWKLLLVAGAAVVAFFKKLFGGGASKRSDERRRRRGSSGSSSRARRRRRSGGDDDPPRPPPIITEG